MANLGIVKPRSSEYHALRHLTQPNPTHNGPFFQLRVALFLLACWCPHAKEQHIMYIRAGLHSLGHMQSALVLGTGY